MRLAEFINRNPSSTIQLAVPTGRAGPAIADIQKVLLSLGYKLPKHGIDGIRGPETSAAVKQFQADYGLDVDGDPGPETVGKLNQLVKDKNIQFTKSTEADVKKSSPQAREIDTKAIQDPDFNKKLDKVASALGVSKKDLLSIMKLESGLDPQAQNKNSKATGLIQFMPKTARQLGTSTEELMNMSAVEQLDYVYKYFKMVGVKPGMTLGDLYLAVFWPAAIGAPDDYVIAKKGNAAYDWNAGLDITRDNILTAGDARRAVSRFA